RFLGRQGGLSGRRLAGGRIFAVPFTGHVEKTAMHVIRRPGWQIPECHATPEHLFSRRAVLAATGAPALSLSPRLAIAQRTADLPDPTRDLYPAPRNEKYGLDRPITDEAINCSYNNFYEFGSAKTIAKAAQALKLRPWTIKIDGMVEKPLEIG